MGHVHNLSTIADADRARLGAKAVNLGRMLRAGLPVPPGFCVDDSVPADDPAIAAAYRALGGGAVAVRSSAAGEDEAGAAAAGVYRSRLGVRGLAELVAAIEDVRRSAGAAHVSTYQPGGPAPRMAVIVQQFVEAAVAGVVFTRDPGDDSGRSLAVAAARGRGTAVVGGAAADRFRIDRANGRVLDQTTVSRSPAPCLTPDQLRDLTTLTLAVEDLFGEPCDIEWAFADGRFWLLQARSITSSPALDLEQLRRREIETLRPLVGPHGTVWVRYQLAESVPRPTPMTWGVLQMMLSVGGGYGRMLRALGFTPDPRVDETGFVQLIAGQPYLNLNLEAWLDHADIPYSVDVAKLKRSPALALRPQRDLLPGRTPWSFWPRVPAIVWRAWRQSRRLRRLRAGLADELFGRVFPAFAAAVREARHVNLAGLSSEAIVARFDDWRRRTLDEFAGAALQPAVFASLGGIDADSAGPRSDTDQSAALASLLRGTLDLPAFLAAFGHRGPEEFELAQPRWSEAPPGRASGRQPDESWICQNRDSSGLRPDARQVTAVMLREAGRHYLMMGYSYLREMLLELDRRFDLAGGMFFLRPDELPALLASESVHDRIRTRRREYNLCRHIWVPTVLFGDNLDAIGRPVEHADVADQTGQPISPGRGEGPAVVATSPADVPTPVRPGFVLVCPYVDAAWLPILVHAAAVVLETGSDLSHGAILLRELGIPAVAGLPGIVAAVAPGDRLRVDGWRGTVARVDPP